MEQQQGAAIVEGVGFALIQRCRLFQAVGVAFQQLGQAGAWQAPQLLLRAQLNGEHGGVLRLVRLDRRRFGARLFDVDQARKGFIVFVVIMRCHFCP
ncbi:hypothetical protein D3C76_1604040 [compost metagenome]